MTTWPWFGQLDPPKVTTWPCPSLCHLVYDLLPNLCISQGQQLNWRGLYGRDAGVRGLICFWQLVLIVHTFTTRLVGFWSEGLWLSMGIVHSFKLLVGDLNLYETLSKRMTVQDVFLSLIDFEYSEMKRQWVYIHELDEKLCRSIRSRLCVCL